MFVVTNRKLNENAKGLEVFGKVPNEKGCNELRLVEVTGTGKNIRTHATEDQLSEDEVKKLIKKFHLEIDPGKKWFGSLKAACAIYEKARREKRHLLVYVHGYNNDMGDVLKTCRELEALYDVVVLAFSWPANGGGIAGYPAYLSDKRDARASSDALNRTIEKIGFFHEKLTEGLRKKLQKKAYRDSTDNPLAAQIKYAELLDQECGIKLNLICHSMGNYVLKYALFPGGSQARALTFDNISLVAADANNERHQQWVELLPVRNRLYIVINEGDFALKWSRRKPGDEQLARLGHYLKNLNATNATYLNVTRASWVKGDHSYFLGDPVKKNKALKELFKEALEGGVAEETTLYRAEGNYYELR